MPQTLFRAALTLTLLAAALSALAQSATTPKVGSPLRKAVLDALRAPVEKQLGPPIVFEAKHFKVAGSWAYFEGMPRRPGGKKVDYSKTKFREAAAEGLFEDFVIALLRKTGSKWKIVEMALGPTDYPTEFWRTKHKGLPASLFPKG
jgi:hypothetical protein